MNTINGIPIVWDRNTDERLFGDLFQGLGNFPDLNSNPNSFKSPLSEKHRPADGSYLKLDDPLSVFTDDFSYTITVNKYDFGLEVLKNYYDSCPETNEIVFFCEKTNPNKSNLFGTFVLVKYGENYKKLINDLKEGKTPGINSRRKNSNRAVRIENYDGEILDNFNILTKNFNIDIDQEKVRFVMDNELQFTSNQYKTVADLFGWYNKSIAFVVDGVNNWLEDLKFKEKDYLPPSKKENQSLALTTLIDYSIPDLLEKFVANTLENALTQIKQYAKENFPPAWVAFLKKAYNTIKGILNVFKKGINFLQEIGRESFYVGRAFLMGFVNGLLSTVQTILSLIGWLLKSNASEKLTGENYRKFQEKLEFIEDFIDLVHQNANDVYIAIENLINNFSIEKVKSALSVFTQKFKNLSIYDCAYMAGLFIFEVVVGVILTIFTGGASLFAEAANATEKIAALLKLFVQEAISTATIGVLEILKLFKILILKFAQACQKGWKGFKQFLEKLLASKADDIVKEEGKVLDEVAGMAENIFPPIRMSVEEFEIGLKKLAKIKPEDALEHLDDALKYFNHYILDGRIAQVSDINCVNVVECVEDFIRTGKLTLAEPSKYQEIYKLQKIYENKFLQYSLPSLKKVMKEGERGIIFCQRGYLETGHVINVMKKEGELIFIDAQKFSGKANLKDGYKSFSYLKTF